MKKRKLPSFVLFLVYLIIFAGCNGVTKSIKISEEATLRGDYYAAAMGYLSVLETKPKQKKAIANLASVAKQAYEQKLNMAEDYENQGSLEYALSEYKELQRYVSKLKAHNALNFVTIDIDKAIKTVSAGAAEQHYVKGEELFNVGEFGKAIEEYKEALSLTSPFKDCREKIAESYYHIASDLEQSGSYRSAADNYENCFEIVSGYKDASQKATALYYALGSHFLSNGHCRKAYEDLEKARKINTQYQDVNDKLAKAKECATIRIAFVKFDNPTGRNVAGMALGDYIFETIKSKARSQASQFIRMIDRDEMMLLAREQNISEGVFSAELTVPIKLEGVDYFIFGRLNQVRDLHEGLSETPMSDIYEYWYDVPYIDSKGKKRYKTEWKKGEMYFTLFKDELSLTIAGVIKVIETKTGAVVITHQISEERSDDIMYAGNLRAEHDLNAKNVTFDKRIKELARARRELKDIGTLANDIINSISIKMSGEILSTLDRTPYVVDPTTLKY